MNQGIRQNFCDKIFLILFRGKNGPNIIRVSPSSYDSNSSYLEWIMNTDLKGSIPKILIRRSTNSFLIEYGKLIKNYLNEQIKKQDYSKNAKNIPNTEPLNKSLTTFQTTTTPLENSSRSYPLSNNRTRRSSRLQNKILRTESYQRLK